MNVMRALSMLKAKYTYGELSKETAISVSTLKRAMKTECKLNESNITKILSCFSAEFPDCNISASIERVRPHGAIKEPNKCDVCSETNTMLMHLSVSTHQKKHRFTPLEKRLEDNIKAGFVITVCPKCHKSVVETVCASFISIISDLTIGEQASFFSKKALAKNLNISDSKFSRIYTGVTKWVDANTAKRLHILHCQQDLTVRYKKIREELIASIQKMAVDISADYIIASYQMHKVDLNLTVYSDLLVYDSQRKPLIAIFIMDPNKFVNRKLIFAQSLLLDVGYTVIFEKQRGISTELMLDYGEDESPLVYWFNDSDADRIEVIKIEKSVEQLLIELNQNTPC